MPPLPPFAEIEKNRKNRWHGYLHYRGSRRAKRLRENGKGKHIEIDPIVVNFFSFHVFSSVGLLPPIEKKAKREGKEDRIYGKQNSQLPQSAERNSFIVEKIDLFVIPSLHSFCPFLFSPISTSLSLLDTAIHHASRT